jgi:hypothetical protein
MDLIYLGIVFIFFLVSLGMVRLCSALQGDSR